MGMLCILIILFSFARQRQQNRNAVKQNILGESSYPTHPTSIDGDMAVVMEPLRYNKLRTIGGTGHLFHLLERLLPYLPALSRTVWRAGSSLARGRPATLHIIFQESYGARDLDSLSAFLLATLVSGGRFDAVVIGHARRVTVTGAGSEQHFPATEVSGLQTYATLACSASSRGRVCSIQYANSTATATSALPLDPPRTFVEVAHISWNFAAKKKYNMVTLPVWSLLHEAVNRTCPAAPAAAPVVWPASSAQAPSSSSHQTAPRAALNDHLSLPPPQLAKKIRRLRNGTHFPPAVASGIPPQSPSDRLVLIYQRDVSRRLRHAERVAKDLQARLDALHALASAPPSRPWVVQVMSHSPEGRSPCELLTALRRATVLITPHGFQSILLLFQPAKSLLVELHPSLYYKPEVFGLVQAGIRAHVGLERYYLSSQSRLKTWYMAAISAVMSWLPVRDAGYCTGNALCRYLARLQEVEMDPAFLQQVAFFVGNSF